MSTFDVAGTVTLASVARPAQDESWAQAMHRLAAKGLISGVEVFISIDGLRAVATSSRIAGRIYNITFDLPHHTGVCTCAGWQVNRMCMHLSLALAKIGALPVIDAEPISAKFPGVCSRTLAPFSVGTPITRTVRGWAIAA